MKQTSKSKTSDSGALRQPRAKRLNLEVPAPLRFPHQDLFPPKSPEPETGIKDEPVAQNDRFVLDTGFRIDPVLRTNRFDPDTEFINAPAARPNQSEDEPGINDKPEPDSNRSEVATGSPTPPGARRPVIIPPPVPSANQFARATGLKLPPATETNPYQEPKTKFFKTPNSVSDVIQQRLSDEEFCLYFRLFRLSHGHRKATCFVGYSALAKALNWSLSKVKRVMPRLLASGYVRLVETYNGPELKGSVYEVFTGAAYEPVSLPDQSEAATGIQTEPNKIDDDHDSKYNPHQSHVMRTYRELTGNIWTKADTAQYERLLDFTAEEIELHLHRIVSRASGKIGSFAFFVTGIENELASESHPPSLVALRKRYREIARQQAETLVGAALPPSELATRLKTQVLRENLTWNNDLANEILGL